MSFILNWHTPGVDLPRYGLFGSDTSPVNLYLLSEKYNIEVAELDGILFRRYNGKNINRNGYGFPLSHSSFDMEKVLRILENDSKERGEGLRFCLCDENQKNAIDAFRNVKWESFDGDSDYIYSCESLSRLVGRHFRGQRNLINRFSRIYSTIEYSPLTEQKLPEALKVAEAWVSEHDEYDDALHQEWRSIQKAAEHWQELSMLGSILSVDGLAVAFTMFSILSPRCADGHFSKSLAKFAADGAYAVIHQRNAVTKEIVECAYMNWEEDMGVPELMKYKECYHPTFKLKKYYGEVFR